MALNRIVRNLIRSYTIAVAATEAVLVIGFLVGQALRVHAHISTGATTTLQIAGAGALLGATLGALNWREGSWTGGTLAEQVDRWLFRALLLGGTFLLVTARLGRVGSKMIAAIYARKSTEQERRRQERRLPKPGPTGQMAG